MFIATVNFYFCYWAEDSYNIIIIGFRVWVRMIGLVLEITIDQIANLAASLAQT